MRGVRLECGCESAAVGGGGAAAAKPNACPLCRLYLPPAASLRTMGSLPRQRRDDPSRGLRVSRLGQSNQGPEESDQRGRLGVREQRASCHGVTGFHAHAQRQASCPKWAVLPPSVHICKQPNLHQQTRFLIHQKSNTWLVHGSAAGRASSPPPAGAACLMAAPAVSSACPAAASVLAVTCMR